MAMKKMMITAAAAAVMLSGAPALADHHGDMKKMKDRSHGSYMIEKMDADGDGAVSRSEFMDAHSKKFDKWDADGDGSITKDEVEARKAGMKEKMKEKKAYKKDAPAKDSGDSNE